MGLADETTVSDRLVALRKREACLRSSIQAELDRERRRRARERERVVTIVGNALLDEADRSPNFKTMLQQTLASSVVDEKSRRVLAKLGWL